MFANRHKHPHGATIWPPLFTPDMAVLPRLFARKRLLIYVSILGLLVFVKRVEHVMSAVPVGLLAASGITTERSASFLSASFAADMEKCENASTTVELSQCDLTDTSRGIPLVWIGNSRTRSALSWDILTSLATDRLYHGHRNAYNTTSSRQPQGFTEALGAKMISEMRILEEHPDEPGHCWMARALCLLQYQNMQEVGLVHNVKSAVPRSAIFGTYWNPYLSAMKHDKTPSALAWLSKYPTIKVVYKRRNFLDMAFDENSELNPESADILPTSEVKNLFYNYRRQDTMLTDLLVSVNYLTVDYEKLYFTTHASEWQRLWDYVVQRPATVLTMEEIHSHVTSWPRLPKPRNETIRNYEKVEKFLLKKEHYTKYLEPIPRVELPPTNWKAIKCVGTTERYHTCDINDKEWGVPVILIGFGRSGSTVTWDTMTALASEEEGQTSVEAAGSGQMGALGQLQQFPHEHGKCWMERILCALQKRNRRNVRKGGSRSSIYGTKWKASLRVFSHRKSREILEWLAVNPHIKVIHNTRNLLDVAISRHKHSIIGKKLRSHCQDDTCAANVTATRVVMPVETAKSSLLTLQHGLAYVKRQLDAFDVPRIHVQYERLYYATPEVASEEWMRLFRFVGVGPTYNLTMDEVQRHMTFVETHTPSRNETVLNWDELVEGLKGTPFEQYLSLPHEASQ